MTRYRILALLTGAQVGASVIQQGFGSLAPFIGSAFDLQKAQIGAVFAIMMLGCTLFTAPAGLAVDRLGERAVVLGSGLLMGGALLAAAAYPAYWWLCGSLFVFGIGYAGATPAGGRAILLWFREDRGFAMGVRQTGVPAGGFIGALAIPLVAAHAGYRGALVFGALVCIVLSVLAAAVYREADGGSEGARRTREIFAGMVRIVRDPRSILVTLTCMALVSAQGTVLSFLALATIAQTRSGIAIGALVFATSQFMAVFGRLTWGVVSDRVFGGDRTLPMIFLCVVAAIGAYGFSLMHQGTVPLAFVFAALLGMSAAGWNGLFAAALSEIGGPRLAGSALGAMLTFIYASSALAAPIFGALVDHYGFPLAWRTLGTTVALGVIPAALAGRAIRKHAASLA